MPNTAGVAEWEVVACRDAIAHDSPAKGVPQQFNGDGCRRTQALDKHRYHGGDHDPLPAPLC